MDNSPDNDNSTDNPVSSPSSSSFSTEERLANLLLGDTNALDAYLVCIEEYLELPLGKAAVRVHLLKSDLTGPRLRDLATRLVHSVLDYAIPRHRKKEADEHLFKTGSHNLIVELAKEAERRFTSSQSTGEVGELLLFLFSELLLRYPQLLCKMSLKTNPNMHYHGIDGVHISVHPHTGSLRFHWGEAKMKSDWREAIRECLCDLGPFLRPGSERVRQDLELIRDNIHLEDAILSQAILNYLDPHHPNFLLREYCGVCLIAFDQSNYPAHPPTAIEELRSSLSPQLNQWLEAIAKRVEAEQLTSVQLDVFCLPLPDVVRLKSAFLEALGRNAA